MSGFGAALADVITDGSLLPAALVAIFAGLVSFLSPCILPLVPGYLGYVTGLAGAGAAAEIGAVRSGAAQQSEVRPDRSAVPAAVSGPGHVGQTDRRGDRRRVLLGAALFVLGFTVVFVSFGALFGGLGSVLLDWSAVLIPVMGVITILMGVAFLGGLPWLQRERRITRRPTAGLAGAPVLGVVFGLGWTPCLGPTLAAINILAYSEASAIRGAVLALAYCLGLGIPFLAIAAGTTRALRASAWARRHARSVMQIGGVMLIVLGLLLVTGLWDGFMNWLRAWLAAKGLATSVV